MTQSKIDLGLKAAIVVMLVALGWVIVNSMQEHIVNAGDTAPNFTIHTDSGQVISTKNFGGKVLMLNFWATWCAPCAQEMPSLNELQRMLGGQGLVVLGVSVDQNEQLYRNMIKRFGVSFQTVRDPKQNYSYMFGTYKVPETYIIDRNGKVVQKIIGIPEKDGAVKPWTDPEVVSYVKSLL